MKMLITITVLTFFLMSCQSNEDSRFKYDLKKLQTQVSEQNQKIEELEKENISLWLRIKELEVIEDVMKRKYNFLLEKLKLFRKK